MNILTFKENLPKAWSKETAYPKDAVNWTPDNPALGQCAVTALLVHHYFGGEIWSGVSDTGIWHFWNVLDGEKIDLTYSQFNRQLIFNKPKKNIPEKLLKSGNVKKRYELLKNNFEKEVS